MIVDVIRGDVLRAPHSHIAFAVNTQGVNDAGFAGMVSSRFWPELSDTGSRELGEILSHRTEDKILYALVCHSLGENGWVQTPEIIEQCLNSIEVPNDEVIAIVLIGGGMIGQGQGADVFANLSGVARSQKKCAVYSL